MKSVKPTRDIYREMMLDASFDSARDFRQIQNVRQKLKTNKCAKLNVADESLAVLGMLNQHQCA